MPEISERVYLAAHSPAPPAWFYKRHLKQAGPGLRFDQVTPDQHEEVAAAWPWHWADAVLKKQGSKS